MLLSYMRHHPLFHIAIGITHCKVNTIALTECGDMLANIIYLFATSLSNFRNLVLRILDDYVAILTLVFVISVRLISSLSAVYFGNC